jgi:hypothetical protein
LNKSSEKTKNSNPNPVKTITPVKSNNSDIIISNQVLKNIENIYKYFKQKRKRYDIKRIQQYLDGEMAKVILKFLGYEISHDNKFKMRPNESTPSTSIRDDGLIRDFGNDWSGRVVNFIMEVYNLDFITSFLYIQNLFGKSNKIKSKTVTLPDPKRFEKCLNTKYIITI